MKSIFSALGGYRLDIAADEEGLGEAIVWPAF